MMALADLGLCDRMLIRYGNPSYARCWTTGVVGTTSSDYQRTGVDASWVYDWRTADVRGRESEVYDCEGYSGSYKYGCWVGEYQEIGI